MEKATIFDIERNSYVDGPGIRTTVFLKGCNLKCKWCHNPESQIKEHQMMVYKNKCMSCGKCIDVCPFQCKADSCTLCGKCVLLCPRDARKISGNEYTAEEVFAEVIKDKAFYDASGGGVTFSGGECMLWIDFLVSALKLCQAAGVHTAVDTAGNVPLESFKKIVPYTNLFLYDIKCIDELLHIKGTGVSNKQIKENLKWLSENFAGDIIIRIPVIGGFNDNEQEFVRIAEFLKTISYTNVELLPYHTLGEHKYDALDMECIKYVAPSDAELEKYKRMIQCQGGGSGDNF